MAANPKKGTGACKRVECPCTGKQSARHDYCCPTCAEGTPCVSNFHSLAPELRIHKKASEPARTKVGLKKMENYLGADVMAWLDDHLLSGLKPSFIDHAIVKGNFKDLTLSRMQELKMGSEQQQTSFIRFRDDQLKTENGEPDRILKRAPLFKALKDLGKVICKKLHSEECKIEEIHELAKAATPHLSDIWKLDWEEAPELYKDFSNMVEVERNDAAKQRPKVLTVDHVIQVGDKAQDQFVAVLQKWIAKVNLPIDCLIVGEVKRGPRVSSKASEVGVEKLFDLNRATILCKNVAQVLNLSNTVMLMFVSPMAVFKNKFNIKGQITEPPCLFYQIGMQLTGEAAELLENPTAPWIVEIQITTEQFYDTKKSAHAFYDLMRESHLPKQCPFCDKSTKHGLHAARCYDVAVVLPEGAAPPAGECAQADQADLKEEEANGPELIVGDEKADKASKVVTCSHCHRKGHEEGGCYIAHPEKQLNAAKNALRKLVGQFGEGQAPQKTIQREKLEQLWAEFAKIKPVFKQVPLEMLGEHISRDASGIFTVLTNHVPCPVMEAEGQCNIEHGDEPRVHRCLFADDCPMPNECPFHKKFPPKEKPAKYDKEKRPKYDKEKRPKYDKEKPKNEKEKPPKNDEEKPPKSDKEKRNEAPQNDKEKPVKYDKEKNFSTDKVIITLISQFGKECEDKSMSMSLAELGHYVSCYNEAKPDHAIPDLATVLRTFRVESDEVIIKRPTQFCTCRNRDCKLCHKCFFREACPRPDCKFVHPKKEGALSPRPKGKERQAKNPVRLDKSPEVEKTDEVTITIKLGTSELSAQRSQIKSARVSEKKEQREAAPAMREESVSVKPAEVFAGFKKFFGIS